MVKNQKVGASMTDPQANLSVIGSFQIVEDAVTGLLGELGLDNITFHNPRGGKYGYCDQE